MALTPRQRALTRIADTIGRHRKVPREHGMPFSTCSNTQCSGIVFLTLRDHHEHQAAMVARALIEALDTALEIATEDASTRGEQPSPVELAEIRTEHWVLTEAPSEDLEARLTAARSGALEAATDEARTRGDVGREGSVDIWDFLEQRAEQARTAAARLDVVEPHDPRVAPAGNAFRRAMAEMGQRTSAAQTAVAIRAALAAIDKTADA